MWSGVGAGDLRPTGDGPGGADRLADWVAGLTDAPALPGSVDGRSRPIGTVHWLHQVHGSTVVVVPSPGEGDAGATSGTGPVGGDEDGHPVRGVAAGEGDALVSATGATGLAVLTADCASIALGSPEGVAAAVHAGWRGLMAGVVERTAEAMVTLGATDVVGALGPCVHPGCYEFSPSDLDRVAARYGDQVRGRTVEGRPALDLPAAVAAALVAAGVRQRTGVDACTGCAGGYFSHRARGDVGRQALVVWSSPQGATG